MVALGAVAGATTRIGLATGMYILPLRHPLAVARATCTLQEVSGGRFRLGIGAGWLREEFVALDVPFESRGARLEEAVEVVRRAWRGGPFAYRGDHFAFDEVQITPRPTPVPLVLGGNSPRALRRAATLGDGWFSSGTPSLPEAIRMRDELSRLRDQTGRGTGPLPLLRADRRRRPGGRRPVRRRRVRGRRLLGRPAVAGGDPRRAAPERSVRRRPPWALPVRLTVFL